MPSVLKRHLVVWIKGIQGLQVPDAAVRLKLQLMEVRT